MKTNITENLREAAACLDRLIDNSEAIDAISEAAQLLTNCLVEKGKVLSCGNGGSMCDAMHFAEELSGRFRQDRAALSAIALSDPAHLTCAGNDFGFDQVFARGVEAHGRNGDVLLAISTSGTSKNIIAAIEAAQKIGVKTITLTGRPDSTVGKLADIDICTPGAAFSDRVQELHIKVIHILIECVERKLFPQNYGERA